MRVLALSDLHLDYRENLEALRALPPHPGDWLVLAGDVGHRTEHLDLALDLLGDRFERLVWTPGNHELWTIPPERGGGEDRYHELVALCRRRGVLTPEDEWAELRLDGAAHLLAPLFLLYDYSFRPADVPREQAVGWAAERDIVCADEIYLSTAPYPSVVEWCERRCNEAEARLDAVPPGRRLVLINHFPLREELIRIRIPRFRIWCGTRRTEDWHRRYPVRVVVTGHLHVRATDWIDGVRFEEVSLGYPRQWRPGSGMDRYLRQILPEPAP